MKGNKGITDSRGLYLDVRSSVAVVEFTAELPRHHIEVPPVHWGREGGNGNLLEVLLGKSAQEDSWMVRQPKVLHIEQLEA